MEKNISGKSDHVTRPKTDDGQLPTREVISQWCRFEGNNSKAANERGPTKIR